MNDTPAKTSLPKLLLEAEAAALLRRSPSHVKRLRLERKLGYFRVGRLVTLSVEDLEIYVASAKMRRVKTRGKPGEFEYVSAGAAPKPFVLLTQAEAAVKFGRTLRQIKYLCSRGHVPYIAGRSALIDEADLAPYFEKKRIIAQEKIPGTPEFEALQRQNASERMRRRLRTKALQRSVARILAEMKAKARKSND